MELIKIIVLAAIASVVVASALLLIGVIWRFYSVICDLHREFKEDLVLDKQDVCSHNYSVFDDGHPEYPWKCPDCGKRL